MITDFELDSTFVRCPGFIDADIPYRSGDEGGSSMGLKNMYIDGGKVLGLAKPLEDRV